VSQDRPTAPELLEALAEYLYVELRPNVPAEQRFKTLVAANVCAVVAREIRAGEEPGREDARLFARLLDTEEASAAELAEAIRAGRLDSRIGELIAGLREHVRRKLEVNRPGYGGPGG
jgi:hypothetical protein